MIKSIHLKTVIILVIVLCISSFFASNGQYCYCFHYSLTVAYAQYTRAEPSSEGPTFNDPNIKAEVVFEGLDNPTSMAFLAPDDILVLQKDEGTVNRIIDRKMLDEPLLHVNVGQQVEWGMLGIAISNIPGHKYVFLYYTKANSASNSDSGDNEESGGSSLEQQDDILGNRLYRYELVNNKLIHPKLLLDLPATSPFNDSEHENNHDGGKVLISPNDSNVYIAVGDIGGREGQAQNVVDGDPFDGSSGILRIGQNGEVISDNPLATGDGEMQDDGINEDKEGNGNENKASDLADRYYAYGIRNSFGVDFDPITGKLWDTENGPTENDEINIVDKGFDSGWLKVQGLAPDDFNSEHELITFGGKGKYSDPEFIWEQPIGPTALKFLNSDRLGKQYENTIFTGDVDNGYLYNFKLNQTRTGLLLDSPLQDKVANSPNELEEGGIIFGKGFGVITDMQVGPEDRYLYVLTYDGTIYKIYSSAI
jgi:glucose/arabinose dehydrogenase